MKESRTGDPAQTPLMASDRYAPFILHGGRNRQRSRGQRFFSRDSYVLFHVADGGATLVADGHRRRLDLPAAVLLPPGGHQVLHITAASLWHRLVFDAVAVERRRVATARTRHHAVAAPQPGPEAVWGLAPPLPLPGEHVDGCEKLMRLCCARWWRDDLGLARANAALGAWLIELVAALAGTADGPLPSTDPIELGLRHACAHLDMGVGVRQRAIPVARHAATLRRPACQPAFAGCGPGLTGEVDG